jgi:hypothetical protein
VKDKKAADIEKIFKEYDQGMNDEAKKFFDVGYVFSRV